MERPSSLQRWLPEHSWKREWQTAVLYFTLLSFIGDKVLLCSLGCPQIHSPYALASRVLWVTGMNLHHSRPRWGEGEADQLEIGRGHRRAVGQGTGEENVE